MLEIYEPEFLRGYPPRTKAEITNPSAMESVPHPPSALVPRKRKYKERAEPRLDVMELHKEEILYMYQQENRTIQQIRDYFVEKGVDATLSQYRNQIQRWGVRKRLKKEEYLGVQDVVQNRQVAGRESQVLVDGVVFKSGKELKRGMARAVQSVSTLEKMKRLLEMQEYTHTALPAGVNITTPPRWTDLAIPFFARQIPAGLLNRLPIGQAGIANIFQRFLANEQGKSLQISQLQSHPYVVFLRMIVFQISNNTVNPHVVRNFLQPIDKLGYREPWKAILAQKSVSVQAVCEDILPWLVWQQDREMVEHVLRVHPQLRVGTPYDVLKYLGIYRGVYVDFEEGNGEGDGDTEERLVCFLQGRGFSEALTRKGWFEALVPRTADDAFMLMTTFGKHFGSLKFFFEVWDPRHVSVEDIERVLQQRGNFAFDDSPFYTNNEGDVGKLFEAGFRLHWEISFLRLLVADNDRVVKDFLQSLPWEELDGKLPVDENFGHELAIPRQDADHAWNLVPHPVLNQIAKKAAEKLGTQFRHSQNREDSEEDPAISPKSLLMYLANLNPEVLIYFVEALDSVRPPEISSKDFLQDLASEIQFEILWNFGYRSTVMSDWLSPSNRLGLESQVEILECFGRKGVDLNSLPALRTNIWNFLLGIGNKAGRSCCAGEPEERTMVPVVDENSTCRLFDLGLSLEAILDIEEEYIPVRRKDAEENFGAPITPIEAAFGAMSPGIFNNLLSRGADAQVFKPGYLLLGHKGCKITKRFVSYIENNDIEQIEANWSKRFIPSQSTKDLFWKAVKSGRTSQAELHLQHITSKAKRLEMLPWLAMALVDLEAQSKDSDRYYDTLKLTRTLVPEAYFESLEPESCQEHFQEAVLWAIEAETPTVLRELLNLPPPYYKSQWVDFPSLIAAPYLTIDTLKELVAQGADINGVMIEDGEPVDHRYLLHQAVEWDDMNILTYLLELGADIYGKNEQGWTVVEYAIQAGKTDTVAIILEFYPDCKSHALEVAEKVGKDFLVQFLREWEGSSIERPQVE